MDPISRFFLWCAGISQRVMDGIDIDYSKYVGLGATIFSTWVLASVSGGYAFYFVFKEQKIAIAFGVMWGLVIFNFDRFIIMTIKKRASFFEELLQMSPRILLAILIGLVISKPLEMKIFESEIKTEITKMSVKETQDYKNNLEREMGIIDLQSQLKEKEALMNVSKLKYIDEMNGLNGGDVGLGKQAEAINKIRNEEKAEAERINLEISNKNAELNDKISSFSKQFEEDAGILRRLEALESIGINHTSLNWAIWLITFLFIVIETGPVISKLFMERSRYDDQLESESDFFLQKAKSDKELYQKLWANLSKERQGVLETIITEWRTSKSNSINALLKVILQKLTALNMGSFSTVEVEKKEGENWLSEQLRGWLVSGLLSFIIVIAAYIATGNWEQSQLSGIGYFLVALFTKNNDKPLTS